MDHGPKTSKTLEKNVRENLCDLGLDVDFLYMTPNKTPKINIEKMDFIKIRHFCSLKDILKEMKKQIRGKILQIIYLIKVLHPKYRENSQKSSNKKITTPIKNEHKVLINTSPRDI